MPTIARLGPYRFFFYSNDGSEPPYVHVERQGKVAKFWLLPPGLAYNEGFGRVEIGRVRALIMAHRSKFLSSWVDFFGH